MRALVWADGLEACRRALMRDRVLESGTGLLSNGNTPRLRTAFWTDACGAIGWLAGALTALVVGT